MKLREAITVLKANTMACWWPSKVMGRQGTDWKGVFGEVQYLLRGIKARQGIPEDTLFYVLDDDDPETDLYGQLTEAVLTIRQVMP